MTVFAEVTNLFDRVNIGATGYDIEELDDDAGFLLIPEGETLLPLIPSVGVRWQFR